MPEEKITSIPAWPSASCYNPAERAVLAYTDCLVYDHGRVPDELFAELQRHLDDEAILELTYITTLYFQHAVMSRALRTEFDDRDEPIVEVPGPPGASAMHPGPAPGALAARTGGRGRDAAYVVERTTSPAHARRRGPVERVVLRRLRARATGRWGGWLRLGMYPNRKVAWWTAWIVGPDRPGVCSVNYALPVPAGPGLVSEDAAHPHRARPRRAARGVPRRRRARRPTSIDSAEDVYADGRGDRRPSSSWT